uniref:Uncharacterized protein n=1 Tax=Coccidioides posadasii RMSCC 3488 TaxID=454284 RepID=A0A0J6F925_COCPO|nr:hypothetical protein CPAG_05847 [Coccidioides posadasii RMSCC 3488]
MVDGCVSDRTGERWQLLVTRPVLMNVESPSISDWTSRAARSDSVRSSVLNTVMALLVAEPRPQDQPYPWAPEWIVPSTNLLDADWRQAAMIVANRPNKAVTALLDFAEFSSAVSNQNGKTPVGRASRCIVGKLLRTL